MIDLILQILLLTAIAIFIFLLPVFVIFGSIAEWIDDAWEDF